MRIVATVIVVLTLGIAAEGIAADTVETWDLGASDVDFYLGADGLGRPSAEGSVYGDMLFGYGLARGFSAYLGTTLQGDRTLGNGHADLYMGLFGTPHEGEHCDLDVFLNIAGGEEALTVTPSIELNLDRNDDHSSWGAYLRAGVSFAQCAASPTTCTDAVFNPGAYLTLGNAGQLLLEYDTTYRSGRDTPGHEWEAGAVALGWNVPMTPSIELINEIHLDIPQADEDMSWGVMTGFIATLPTPGARP